MIKFFSARLESRLDTALTSVTAGQGIRMFFYKFLGEESWQNILLTCKFYSLIKIL